MRTFLRHAFLDTETKTYFVMQDVLAVATVISIVAVAADSVPSFTAYDPFLTLIEWTTVCIFTFEYIARLLVTVPRSRYIFSFFGIIDLTSILPTFLGIGNLTFLKSARIIRIIRLLRLAQIAKLKRHAQEGEIEHAAHGIAFNVFMYIVVLTLPLLVLGTALYLIETATGIVANIPSGIWWVVHLFFGEAEETAQLSIVAGLLYVLARFFGLVLIGALVGLGGSMLVARITRMFR